MGKTESRKDQEIKADENSEPIRILRITCGLLPLTHGMLAGGHCQCRSALRAAVAAVGGSGAAEPHSASDAPWAKPRSFRYIDIQLVLGEDHPIGLLHSVGFLVGRLLSL